MLTLIPSPIAPGIGERATSADIAAPLTPREAYSVDIPEQPVLDLEF